MIIMAITVSDRLYTCMHTVHWFHLFFFNHDQSDLVLNLNFFSDWGCLGLFTGPSLLPDGFLSYVLYTVCGIMLAILTLDGRYSQNLSSLFLKALMVGDRTTSSGRLFLSSKILSVKKLFLTLQLLPLPCWCLLSFRLFPLVDRLFPDAKSKCGLPTS